MRASSGRGALAGGSRLTVEAGLRALELGGNAVDAAVAASMAAWVAEPLFTGLGGGGIGMVRMAGEVYVWDFFSDMPGRDLARQAGLPAHDYAVDFSRYPMSPVELDYGPTTQVFFGGRGTVAVPGMPRGLWELHQRHGQLPMAQLAQPAVRAASEGVPVTRCFEDTGTLVGNILRLTPAVEALLRRPDGPMRAGDLFHHPLLGQTIARYATEGPQFLETGDGAQAMLRMLGAASAIGPLDLQQQRPMRREPLRLRYRDAQVWLPGAPSLGGLLVACAMAHLQAAGPMPPLPGAAFVRRVAEAMQAAETRAGPALLGQMSQPGFQASFLASCPLGSTTHISAMDRAGNAVGLTTSLGATSGHMVPETGILLNNFLGERDVNPPHPRRSPGQRLVTMTCPTLLHTGASSFIMGSGGSSRIRSAIMHGLMYLVDHRLPAAQAVGAPRSHMEGGSLRVELTGRPAGTWGALRREHPSAVPFSTPDFYFGGLHVAGLSSGVFVGAGDTRRSGEFGWT